MTIESMLSDTKYAYRALRRWLQETARRRPSTSRAQSQPVCQHRILIGHKPTYLYNMPCADCGKPLMLSDFATRWGRFYVVAAETEEE